MPNAIKTDWEAIKLLICAGTTYREVAEQFQIKEAVIRKRASREKWPTPNAVKNKTRQLQAIRARGGQEGPTSPIIPVSQRVTNELVTAKMADNWLEKGVNHRALAFEIATKALKAIKDTVPALENWSDIERADKMARRASGLDSSEGPAVNVNLQLVNQRLQQIALTMPLDALEDHSSQ